MDVEVLDQNRQPLAKGTLDITGATGALKTDKPLIEGHYYIKAGDVVRSTRVHAPGADGKMLVESRDYPYKLEL